MILIFLEWHTANPGRLVRRDSILERAKSELHHVTFGIRRQQITRASLLQLIKSYFAKMARASILFWLLDLSL